jgi:hypothetical protein
LGLDVLVPDSLIQIKIDISLFDESVNLSMLLVRGEVDTTVQSEYSEYNYEDKFSVN